MSDVGCIVFSLVVLVRSSSLVVSVVMDGIVTVISEFLDILA